MNVKRFSTMGLVAVVSLTLCVANGRAAESVITEQLSHAMRHHDGPHRVVCFFEDVQPLSLLDPATLSRTQRIVAMQENARASRAAFLATFGGSVSGLRTFWLVNAAAMVADEETIRAIADEPSVRRLDLDAEISLLPTRVENTAQRGKWAWGLEAINVPQAREAYGLEGTGVRVGIIDTGCDATHPDLAGKVVAFKDFVNDKPESYDDQGHGTHCCGTMVGGNAGGTYIGVAPKATLVVAKALSGSGSGYNSWLMGAMEFMADPDGDPATDDAPVVVNNSWGSSGNDTSFVEAVQAWIDLGIFPAFAAGNSGPFGRTVGIPGGYLESFAVGSTSSWGWASTFSSRGPVTWDGVDHVKPDVAAPGSSIYSAKAGGGYTKLSGTSMACPHVTGVIALLHQANPNISIEDIRATLEGTAVDKGDDGKDNTYGSGLIRVDEALKAVLAR